MKGLEVTVVLVTAVLAMTWLARRLRWNEPVLLLAGGCLCRDLRLFLHGAVVPHEDQHRHAGGGAYLAYPFPHAGPCDRVETDGRLVQYEQPRRAHERLCQLQPPHHPPGVRPRQPVGRVTEPDRFQGRGNPRGPFAPGHVEDPGEQRHVLPARQPRVGGQRLGYVAEQAPYRHLLPGDVLPEHPHHAGWHREQRRHGPDRRGLPRPVRAQQPEHLTGTDRQVQPVHRPCAAERVLKAHAPHGLFGTLHVPPPGPASSCRP
jgi:hypothetical protein